MAKTNSTERAALNALVNGDKVADLRLAAAQIKRLRLRADELRQALLTDSPHSRRAVFGVREPHHQTHQHIAGV